jgi:hypothetical protein
MGFNSAFKELTLSFAKIMQHQWQIKNYVYVAINEVTVTGEI